jgi:hypothetical protein
MPRSLATPQRRVGIASRRFPAPSSLLFRNICQQFAQATARPRPIDEPRPAFLAGAMAATHHPIRIGDWVQDEESVGDGVAVESGATWLTPQSTPGPCLGRLGGTSDPMRVQAR